MTKRPAQPAIAKALTSNKLKVLTFPLNLEKGARLALNIYEYRTGVGRNVSPVRDLNEDPIRRIYNADRQSVNNAITKQGLATIFLPLPEQLKENYRANYESTELGGLAETLSGITEATDRASEISTNMLLPYMKEQDRNASATDPNTSSTFGEGVGVAAMAAARLAASSLGTASGNGSLFTNLFDLNTGTIQNPNIAVLFRGPSLRSHTFSWKLIARDDKESKAIEQIVAVIKRAMHPGQINKDTAVFLKYPAECWPEFTAPGKSNFLFAMRPCVITDIDVNYAGAGVPSFYTDYSPTIVELRISLMETSYSTREDFDDRNNLAFDGNANIITYQSEDYPSTTSGDEFIPNYDAVGSNPASKPSSPNSANRPPTPTRP